MLIPSAMPNLGGHGGFFAPKMLKRCLPQMLLFFGFYPLYVAAQMNLVPNASFEDLSDCPELGGQIYLAPPWFSATLAGSPDLHNACALDESFGVPYNSYSALSYQPSRSGAGYAGIFVYSHFSNIETREYIETPLTKSLEINKQYFIRFFVSPSNSSIDDAPCFCDGIGAAFQEDKFISQVEGLHALTDIQPELDKTAEIMTDTVNWIPVTGCFTNQETEKNYLIIGNFRDNDHTMSSSSCDLTFPNVSYLYIEDVGVWEFDPLPDTILLCPGANKDFQVSFLEAEYTWIDGSTDSTFHVSKEGKYAVSATIDGCILSDTMVVIQIEHPETMVMDTLICQGDKLTLNAPFPGNYAWSTGAKGAKIEVVEAGEYILSLTNECGLFQSEWRIETEVCDCPIYVPNVFSPDDNGLNDELLVFAACDFPIQVRRFQVFDRWGSLVFNSTADAIEQIRWNGAWQDKPAPTGVYTWVLEYDVKTKGLLERKFLKGDITILR